MIGGNWNLILSDLFVNLAAGWFGSVFIEYNIDNAGFLTLTYKFTFGILSLGYAKYFKDRNIYE